jgi:LDH2 family malate/lactate/ureidoglycolate dehydrogenase
MAIPGFDKLWRLVRRVDDVFQKVDNTTRALDRITDELRAVEKRVAALEGREELLVEKARSAAGAAASSAVTQNLVEVSRRIGVLEERNGGQKRIE